MGHANAVMLDDYPVRYASLEDTIIHKIFAGRPRDVEDLRHILRKHPGFDREYTKEWLDTLSPAVERDLWNELLKVIGS